ncbi:hypothetical protein [Halobacillus halophilus]|uniref:hypothetical protein n=1 Tax=Halobacillus halophilus TaxID=1570 RepID=UPI001CD6DAAC|nr:hypothetical protein [Halobacillus halophilus]MCA1011398.1 hypothetical protein [Halobacillus halophilus]
MNWETIITLLIGATIPLVVSWLNSMAKFHYETKTEEINRVKKDIRSYQLIKTNLKFLLVGIRSVRENNYSEEMLEITRGVLDKSKLEEKVVIEDIPLAVFEEYLAVIGTVEALKREDNLMILNKQSNERFIETMDGMENSVDRLIKKYEKYKNSSKKLKKRLPEGSLVK